MQEKHCRDCRFAVCKPFSGRMVWNDRVRNHDGGLGVYLDSTKLWYNPKKVRTVRCSKGQWVYKNDSRTPGRPARAKTVAHVENLMLPINALGKMAEDCPYFEDMREEEDGD